MSLTETPVCNFGEKIKDFKLISTEDTFVSLKDIKGQNGTLIMFICNHCPYVKAIIRELVDITNKLAKIGINSVAIMSNDVNNYPEDSFENMKKFAKINNFKFPYLYDETLQYRGRFTEMKNLKPVLDKKNDLLNAMELIAKTSNGPKQQFPSMGCNIKWKR
jgi:peroxiredoxin